MHDLLKLCKFICMDEQFRRASTSIGAYSHWLRLASRYETLQAFGEDDDLDDEPHQALLAIVRCQTSSVFHDLGHRFSHRIDVFAVQRSHANPATTDGVNAMLSAQALNLGCSHP